MTKQIKHTPEEIERYMNFLKEENESLRNKARQLLGALERIKGLFSKKSATLSDAFIIAVEAINQAEGKKEEGE